MLLTNCKAQRVFDDLGDLKKERSADATVTGIDRTIRSAKIRYKIHQLVPS